MHQSPTTPSDLYGRQILRRIMPILVTCSLVYWLSGGIPPASWEQLVQVCTHFSTLLASRGTEALSALLILFVQALFIGFAWGFLIWLLVREFQALRTSINPQSYLDAQRSASFHGHAQGQIGVASRQSYQAPALEQSSLVGVRDWQMPFPTSEGMAGVQSMRSTTDPFASPSNAGLYAPQMQAPFFENPFADETQGFPLATPPDQALTAHNKQTRVFDNPFDEQYREQQDQQDQQEQYAPSLTSPSRQISPPLSALSIPLPNESIHLSEVATPFDTQESGELERLEPATPGSDEVHYSDVLGTLGFMPTRPSSSSHENQERSKPAQPIQRAVEPPQPTPAPVPQEQAITRVPFVAAEQAPAVVPPIPAPPATPPAPPASMPAHNPFDVQPDIFDLFGLGTAPVEPILPPIAPQHSTSMPESAPSFAMSAGTNPFEEEALPALQPASTALVRASQTSMVQPEPTRIEEDDDEEDDPFIFGNPFEGPLPDVFHQDSDLRQSVLEHTGDVIEAPIEQTRAKKKRHKKRSTPTQQP
jgi:hypothetical protein